MINKSSAGNNIEFQTSLERQIRNVPARQAAGLPMQTWPTWTLMGISLAACIGGGGGAGSTRTQLLSIQETNGERVFQHDEISVEAFGRSMLRESGADLTVRYEIMTAHTVKVTFDNHSILADFPDVDFIYTLSGPDKDRFEFFDSGFGVFLRTADTIIDYENPLDADQNNVYELTETITTTDGGDTAIPEGFNVGFRRIQIRVLDILDDEAPVTELAAGKKEEQTLPSGIKVTHIGESNKVETFGPINDEILSNLAGDVNIFNTEIDGDDARTVRVTIREDERPGLQNQDFTPFDYVLEIMGEDAEDFKFAKDGADIQIMTVDVVEYKNLENADGYDTYKITLKLSTEDERIPTEERMKSFDFEFRVYDVADDEAHVASESFSDSVTLETQMSDIL